MSLVEFPAPHGMGEGARTFTGACCGAPAQPSSKSRAEHAPHAAQEPLDWYRLCATNARLQSIICFYLQGHVGECPFLRTSVLNLYQRWSAGSGRFGHAPPV